MLCCKHREKKAVHCHVTAPFIWKWRQSLARQFAATCFFYMPFWVLIRRLALTVLEKPRPLKICWICLLPRSTIRHPGINSSRGCDSRRECSSGAVWRKTKSLDSLGYRRYYENVETSGQQRQPQNLPPTSSAARYHSLRVFLQVEQWQCLSDGMQFEDWGWKLSGNQVIPVTTDHFSRVLAQDDSLQLCNWLCLCKV